MERLKIAFENHKKAELCVCAFCVLFYVAAVCWAGGSLWELLAVALAVPGYIVLPGHFFLRLSGMRKEYPQLAFPLTVLFGTGALTVLYCVTMRLGLLWLLRILPPVLSVCEAVLWLREKRSAKSGVLPVENALTLPRRLLMLMASALIFFCAFSNVLHYARPSRAGDVLIAQDFLWMVGNAKSFQLAFPSIEIRFYNVRFAYHYLTEMLCGILGLVTGADCYNILGFYMQPFMLAALVLCLYGAGMVFFRENRKKALLFPISLFVFGCASLWAVLPDGESLVGNSNITHLLTNITSQTTAYLYLSIFCALFLTLAQKGFRASPLSLAALLCSFVMLTVAKGPVALLTGLAALVTVVFMLFQRRAGLRAVLVTAVSGAVFVVLYGMLFSASTNGSMSLTLTGTVQRFILQDLARAAENWGVLYYAAVPLLWLTTLALLAPAAFLPYLSAIGRDLKGLFRLSPERLLAEACAAGGLLAYFLYNHPNYSQVYFLLTSLFFINLLAIDRAEVVLEALRGAKKVKKLWAGCAVLGAAVALVTACFLYIHIGGSGLRAFLRDVGLEAKYPYPTVICADDETAALWLAENTDGAETMFATNRIHSDTIHFDGISNVYTAFSGRQAFMEGYAYVADSAPWMWVDERKAVNAQLFSAETPPETLRALCEKYGITHLIYSTQMQGDETQLAGAFPCVYTSDRVRIYEVK